MRFDMLTERENEEHRISVVTNYISIPICSAVGQFLIGNSSFVVFVKAYKHEFFPADITPAAPVYCMKFSVINMYISFLKFVSVFTYAAKGTFSLQNDPESD
jgi:hypothetical protein